MSYQNNATDYVSSPTWPVYSETRNQAYHPQNAAQEITSSLVPYSTTLKQVYCSSAAALLQGQRKPTIY